VAEHTERRCGETYAPEVSTKNLPSISYKDMPEPEPLRKSCSWGSARAVVLSYYLARFLVFLVIFAVLLAATGALGLLD